MSADRDRRYLQYIREAIGLIERRTHSGREAFLRDLDIQDGVLWRLQTLAEATGKLSEELKRRHPEVPWRSITDFRNRLAHGDLDVKPEQVWA